MTTAHRDLSSPDLWERSLERSLYRRALLPGARRRQNRRKGIAAAMSAATMAGPGSPMAFAGLTGKPQADLGAQTAPKRVIEVRDGGLPLELGSQGALVASVQKALGIPADGIFGNQTDDAVRRYQARAGLEVDGIVGPATWSALFAATSAARGGDAPPAVKQRLERELRAAGARLEERQDRSLERLFGADGQDGSAAERSSNGAPGAGEQPGAGQPADQEPDPRAGAEEPGAEEPGAEQPDAQQPAPDRDPQPSPPVGTSCGSSTLTSPVKGTVTSGFGPRWGRAHEGVDIAAPTGTAIRAAACGSVTVAGVQSGYGNIVCITHSSRFATCYAHMSRFAVSQGARVRAGQVIGYVGCTGSCTGPHVHFETRVNGEAQDPSPYLNGSRAASASAASRATARSGAAGGRTAATMSTGGGATVAGGAADAQASWSGSGGSTASESVAAGADSGEVTVAPTAPTEVAPPAVPVEPVAAPVPVEPVAAPVPVEPAPVPVEPVAAPVPVEPVATPAEPVAVPVEPVAAPVPVEPAPVPVEPVAAPVPEPVATPVPVEPVAAPAEPIAAPAEPVVAPAEPIAAPAEPVAAPAPSDAAPVETAAPSQ